VYGKWEREGCVCEMMAMGLGILGNGKRNGAGRAAAAGGGRAGAGWALLVVRGGLWVGRQGS
jgi:hypothetical protein